MVEDYCFNHNASVGGRTERTRTRRALDAIIADKCKSGEALRDKSFYTVRRRLCDPGFGRAPKTIREDLVAVRDKVKILQGLALVLTLSGCVTGKSVDAINQSQRAIQASLSEQALQIQMQAEHIEHLQLLQSALNHMMSEVAIELDAVNDRLEDMRPPPSEKSSTPPASNDKPNPAANHLGGKFLLGRVEWVWLDALNQILEAEVNTGVRNSLLYVKSLQVFERDGNDWVRFEMAVVEGDVLAEQQLEAPVARMTKIRLSADGGYDKRPTIKTNIRIGELVEQAEFVLTPSVKITTSAVLGRNFLRDIAVVDVARKHTHSRYTPKPL